MECARFKLQNTRCAGCEQAIREGLASMPGVQSVRVDRDRDEVEVTGTCLNRAALVTRLWELGYPEL